MRLNEKENKRVSEKRWMCVCERERERERERRERDAEVLNIITHAENEKYGS